MKLSVIIPVYNVEKYLARCIDSILNQEDFQLSSDNIEIVLVNDGSLDNSQSIIDQYVSKYDFIKGLKKGNGGLSSARNFGLEYATGDYIWFVDSDDWIDKKSFKIIFNEIIVNQLDILEFDLYLAKIDNDENASLSLNLFYHSIRTEKINGIEAFELYGYIVGVCFKVIKKELFINNKLRFPLGELNEDNVITYELMKNSNSYKKIAVPLYYYYERIDSITNNVNKEHLYKYINDQINNILKINNLIKKESFSKIKIREMLCFYATNAILSILKLKDPLFLKEQIERLEKEQLYPIKKYSYHNKGIKRNLFIKLINQKWLIYKLNQWI
ncbi:glycosyltransferase involved in cell wall biosynthesis [Dysgonomonadaceae bacterium PH5-43]|nr:glycosyltransferase involved in cell wall biosynthesis [Dysgonomonadaceae bacterium PH5-43]